MSTLVSSIALICLATAGATAGGSIALRRITSPTVELVITAAVANLLLLAPFALEAFVAARFHERPSLFHDLRFAVLIIPGAAAVLTALPLVRSHGRIALAIWAWTALLGALNTVNKCSPGYCASYGFPIPFFSWSDASNLDGSYPQSFHPGMLLIDAFFIVAPLIAASSRRMRLARELD